ncbi:MAG: hypothetical protein OXC63_07165 [Aestuariivita sp.]|nr:hypothetical protein [Aestuariivita sp.]MCY4346402.1 hypothetical protein [Aestuariivita sp.]
MNNDAAEELSEERDNALAIAKLEGELKAIRAENDAMASRIDTKLTELGGAIDKQQAELLAEIAKRDKETAQRDKDNLRWSVGLAIACTTIILGAMAVMLTLPVN